MRQSLLKLALFGLFVQASCAYAYTISPPTKTGPFEINIPSLSPGWEFAVSSVYLQPTASSQNYAIFTKPFPIATPNWHVKSINPNYTFDFALMGRFIFPCSGNDLQLSWTHLHTENSRSVSASGSDFVGPFYQIGPRGGLGDEGRGTSKYQYDVVNLDAGQFVNLGSSAQLRLFAGLQELSLKNNLISRYSGTTPLFNLVSNNVSKTNSVGPRFGLDATYAIGYGFGVVGEIAGSLLVGSTDTKMRFDSTSAVLMALGLTSNQQSIKSDKTTQLIPSFNVKLGLNYSRPLNCSSIFTIEAGYQAATYINALNQFQPDFVVADVATGTVAVGSMGQTKSNFSVNGPYVTIAYKI